MSNKQSVKPTRIKDVFRFHIGTSVTELNNKEGVELVSLRVINGVLQLFFSEILQTRAEYKSSQFGALLEEVRALLSVQNINYSKLSGEADIFTLSITGGGKGEYVFATNALFLEEDEAEGWSLYLNHFWR